MVKLDNEEMNEEMDECGVLSVPLLCVVHDNIYFGSNSDFSLMMDTNGSLIAVYLSRWENK